MAKTKRADVRESLLTQLEAKGASLACYIDLIDDYMSFWDTKGKLIRDIRKRGVTYTDVSSVGVEMQKNNPSVKELSMVNRQMLSILKEMGINTSNASVDDDDDL